MKPVKHILDNGLTIILFPDRHATNINAVLAVNAGSRNETPEIYGMAHFVEHMCAGRATKNRQSGEAIDLLKHHGVTWNAQTSQFETCYWFHGNHRDLYIMLDVMIDNFFNPIFKIKEIELEKRVVIEELRMFEDQPFFKNATAANARIFRDTSLSHPVVGDEEVLHNVDRRAALSFWRNLYTPQNTVLLVNGPFVTKNILKKLISVLKRIPTQKPEPRYIPYRNDPQKIVMNIMSQKTPYIDINLNKTMKQVYVMIVFTNPHTSPENKMCLDGISNYLTDGLHSAMYKRLQQENGISYWMSSHYHTYYASGLFTINFITTPESFEKSLSLSFDVIKNLRDHGLSKFNFKQLLDDARRSVESPISIDHLITYATDFFEYGEITTDLYEKNIKKITPKQVQSAAQDVFQREHLNIFVTGNVTLNKSVYQKILDKF